MIIFGMDLYAEYRREKDGATVLLDVDGFVVYQIQGDRCHIGELYVRKERRNTQYSRELLGSAIEDARLQGCKVVTYRVAKNGKEKTKRLSPSPKNSRSSIKGGSSWVTPLE